MELYGIRVSGRGRGHRVGRTPERRGELRKIGGAPTCTPSSPRSRQRPTPATTPRSSPRRRSCDGWWRPAPGSSSTAARCRRPGRRRGRRPGAGRGVRGHRTAHRRGLRAAGRTAAADDGRDRLHRLPRRPVTGRSHGIRRSRQTDERTASGPDDHRRRPTGCRQGARPRHPAAHPERLDDDGPGLGR